MLTRDRAMHLFSYDPDTGVFTRKQMRGGYKKGSAAGTSFGDGYVRLTIDRKSYMAHRVAWLMVHGCWPSEQLDHINNVRNDNRLCNLREATATQNEYNKGKRKNNTSGFKGVDFDSRRNKWRAKIRVSGRRIQLGLHNTPEEAYEAYCKAAKELHQEFCNLG
ncbi:HNH endonuclease [Serratia fonticola]|uniref:HNH endonuclease n=1 Tax=Serratia fonticola TaxID=47917 RepID=UPI003AAAC8B9